MLLSIAGDLGRSGAMRAVAADFAREDPAFACLHGIDPGDALALATRFARGYAYRGAQALLWSGAFSAKEVQDRYLPAAPLRPFGRRGILQVDGSLDRVKLTLVATQFAADRDGFVRELRFARHVLRGIGGPAVFFIAGMNPRAEKIGFSDLGFAAILSEPEIAIYARGIEAAARAIKA